MPTSSINRPVLEDIADRSLIQVLMKAFHHRQMSAHQLAYGSHLIGILSEHTNEGLSRISGQINRGEIPADTQDDVRESLLDFNSEQLSRELGGLDIPEDVIENVISAFKGTWNRSQKNLPIGSAKKGARIG